MSPRSRSGTRAASLVVAEPLSPWRPDDQRDSLLNRRADPVLATRPVMRLHDRNVKPGLGDREPFHRSHDCVMISHMFEGFTVERVEVGAGPRWRLDYQIACKAYSGSGGDDITVHRAEASQLLADVEAALRADRTLGGQVARVRMGEVERWDEGRAEQGTGVRVGFTVDATVLP